MEIVDVTINVLLFQAPSNQSAATPGDSDDDVVMYASSDELLSLSDKSRYPVCTLQICLNFDL